MGCVCSKPLKEGGIELTETRNKTNEAKLLLLGPGGSGKSTIVKQIRIIFNKAFRTIEERNRYKEIIYQNIVYSIQTLIAASYTMDYKLEEKNKKLSLLILQLPDKIKKLPINQLKAIYKLWKDPSIQKVFLRSSEFQLYDTAKYFLNSIPRIAKSTYIPNVDDILHSRSRTTGILQITVKHEDFVFRFFDVGGQRSERKKWIHCFSGVTAILFVLAIGEYDQKLFEDENINRMEESLLLFNEICNSRFFSDTSIILIFNKTDVFREKIKTTDLSVCFNDYNGGNSFEETSEFIKNKFISLNNNPKKKKIYPHFTCATDTDEIYTVFNSVKNIAFTQYNSNL
ncbi:g protein alpha i subunit [Anaeramoeba flamelloides]|uniref:G protein alpha i subunit n=1 Tax=Anaeramoeba flamelloides TaxID=1746091 RepID=A0AAV7ZLQ9_9EUKA|nr:g protein alpha i subunit [Anaeramoeba flamelloides]KAJ6226878.1 g protein alpha i subunit [Anaeramoeba flamelloides]